MILAMAPGGIAEMCITAKVLQLGVPLVTAAQVARVLVLISHDGTGVSVASRFPGAPLKRCCVGTLSERPGPSIN